MDTSVKEGKPVNWKCAVERPDWQFKTIPTSVWGDIIPTETPFSLKYGISEWELKQTITEHTSERHSG